MARRLLFLMIVIGVFAGTGWMIFYTLNATGMRAWPDWVPH